jgi:hypothetical protein
LREKLLPGTINSRAVASMLSRKYVHIV